MRRHITPSVQRVLDRLDDAPVLVIDAAWEIIAANPLAVALIGDLSGDSARERNIAWREFRDLPSRVVRTAAETDAFQAQIVADLHAALGRHPDDEPLQRLIEALRGASLRFEELWEQRPVASQTPPVRRSRTRRWGR